MKVKAIGKIAFDAVYEANAERVIVRRCTIPITIIMRQKRSRKRYF